ncbi:MAG: DUF4058 family protein [Anaerolineae bacterium]|nr:DUF4058 family protein [Anaerolineae bacterium]
MNPINPVKNQYRGINAHLHSYWQAEGGWDSFHTNHISDLMRLIDSALPAGYVADIEQSLQIRRFGQPFGKPESDVTIYDTNFERHLHHPVRFLGTVEAVAIPEIMSLDDEVSEYRAVAIYEYVIGKHDKESPVAWIELLSPSNKRGGQNAAEYRIKRLKLLQSGIVFVEIDYLHESPPNFTFKRDALTHPYHIVVVDPRPEYYEGLAYPYHFDADEIIPTVEIPLNGDDGFAFDFGIAYDKTLSETHYARRFMDYTQPPLNFDRYNPDDQARIINRMIAVLEADQQGADLESVVPLSVEALPLEEALPPVQMLGVTV